MSNRMWNRVELKVFVFPIILLLVACGGSSSSESEQDTTPDAFAFAPVETAALSSLIESEAVVVSGITAATNISIENGEYQVGSAAYTATSGQVTNGQLVRVRVTAADNVGETVTARLTIGGVGADFSVTTVESSAILERVVNASCLAPEQVFSGDPELRLEAVFNNLPALSRLVGLYQAPGGSGRWYAMQQSGEIYWFNNDDSASQLNEFIDLNSLVRHDGERGLLGLAFHPDFETNGQFFVSYTDNSGDSVVSRFISDGNLPLDLSSESVVLTLSQPAGNHNGGHIAFGPDGYLYIGFGDGGGANDQYGNGQNTNSLHGTLLRIDINQDTGYSIPQDNPFIENTNVRDEIYAYGLRNPWRFSFDTQTGELWLGDVGQNQYEEINIVSAGDNLGWPIMEGNHCFQSQTCDQSDLTLPKIEYNHSDGDCSVTGGYVYRGQQTEALFGDYLFGDFCTGRLWHSRLQSDDSYSLEQIALTGMSISSFAQAQSGEVYLLNYFGDAGEAVYRVVDDGASGSEIPAQLSQVGCFDSTSEKTMRSGVVPYQVQSQLWSDGADKTRFFAIPDSELIDVVEDGDFEFPVGTMMIKNFVYQNQYLETRLFMRHASGWGGYSYKWRDDQTDADLLESGDTVVVGGHQHIIPSRGQCFECHTSATAITLGPEASQLDNEQNYDGGIGNQLTTLFEAGYLSAQPAPEQIHPMAEISDDTASLAVRARSYLHANCSGCHRPGSTAPQIDFRISSSLAELNACDVEPVNGDLGITDARIIAPGDANRSVLLARMSVTDDNRMPPLATQQIDQTAVNVLQQWINQLTGCNE